MLVIQKTDKIMTSFKKGNVTFHVVVSDRDADRQTSKVLIGKLREIFARNHVNTSILDKTEQFVECGF